MIGAFDGPCHGGWGKYSMVDWAVQKLHQYKQIEKYAPVVI